MKFEELPIEVQEQLRAEIAAQANTISDSPFSLKIYSKNGKRWIYAYRCVGDCVNKNGNPWRLGGPQNWTIQYGAVQFESYRNPLGEKSWRLCESKVFSSKTLEDGSVLEIPRTLHKKAEVLEFIANFPGFDPELLPKKNRKSTRKNR